MSSNLLIVTKCDGDAVKSKLNQLYESSVTLFVIKVVTVNQVVGLKSSILVTNSVEITFFVL